MGVDVQVVGPMPMHRYWAEPDLALQLATVTNEAVAAHCADGKGRLAGLGAVIFVHPWGCSLGPRLSGNYLGNTFGQPAETALALSRLIFDGTLDRHPALKLLAAHGGGFLPTYAGRSDHAWENRPDARGCARRPSEYLREIWYDALVYTPRALRHLVDTAGAGQVVLGTDYPFDMGVTDPVARATAAALPPADLTAILSGNAATLFGLGPLPS
jgi:predicted TIM-barrel fold metal-dependent hydrolase